MAEGDELSVRVVGRYQSQNVVNTLHYIIDQQAAAETEVTASMLTGWEAACKTEWLAAHLDTYNLEGLKCYVKKGDPLIPDLVVVNEAGAVVGDEIPAAVCRTITLYTASANRRKRGRVMLSGTPAAHLDTTTGGVTSAGIVILDTLGLALMENVENAGDVFKLILPTVLEVAFEPVIGFLSRVTPSLVSSRRIKRFLIG